MTVYVKPTVRSAWAETAAVSDITDPGNTFVSAGWAQGVKPPRQYMNWVLNYAFEGIRYLCQWGIAEYDPNETYRHSASVLNGANGILYFSLQDNNIGHPPATSPTWWGPLQTATAPNGDVSSNVATTAFLHNNYLPIGSGFGALSGLIGAGQVPVGAVVQWQGALSIAGSQVSSAVAQANTLLINGGYRSIQWIGQAGQPTWLIGSNDGANFLIWNPANFSVANSAQLAGLNPTTGATGSTVAVRDSNGYLWAQYFNQASPNNENPGISQVMVTNGGDGFLRKASLTAFAAALGMGAGTFATGNPGWFQIPGTPFIVQAGTANPNGGTITVTFPKRFPNACISVVGTSSAAPTQCNTFNKSQTSVQIASTGGTADWIAIGY